MPSFVTILVWVKINCVYNCLKRCEIGIKIIRVKNGVCVLLTDTLDYWQLLPKVLTSEKRGKQVWYMLPLGRHLVSTVLHKAYLEFLVPCMCLFFPPSVCAKWGVCVFRLFVPSQFCGRFSILWIDLCGVGFIFLHILKMSLDTCSVFVITPATGLSF